jgi:CRP/FNR family transcriptional regulator, cyclic AMP receptor protein
MSALENPMVRLLDVDPGLGARLRDDDRAEARDLLTLRTQLIEAGDIPTLDPHASGHAIGLVVLSGLLLDQTQIDDHASIRVLGPGDIALPRPPAAESLSVSVRWTAATETRVAVLDDRLQQPFAMWPGLALALVDRIAEQAARAGVHKAIAQMPRVEDRLEATFWELADRWGRVTPGGIHVPLRLTHDVLARLVGGRRPTISLALGVLAERGTLVRRPDGSWLLTASEPSFTHETEPPPAHATWIEPDEHALRPMAARPWAPNARAELAATVRRIGDEHHVSARRILEDLQRYEATRQRSQALRLTAARARAARRSRERPITRRTPAAP